MVKLAVLAVIAGCYVKPAEHYRDAAGDVAVDGPGATFVAVNFGVMTDRTVTIPINPSAVGNFLIVAVTVQSSNPSITITDDASTTWTSLAPQLGTPCGSSAVQLWYGWVGPGNTPHQVTISQAAGETTTAVAGYVVEYANIATSDPVDVRATTTAFASSNAMSVELPQTHATDLIFALFADNQGNGVMMPGSDYALEDTDGYFYSLIEDRVAAPGAYTPNATLPTGVSDPCWMATVAAFRSSP